MRTNTPKNTRTHRLHQVFPLKTVLTAVFLFMLALPAFAQQNPAIGVRLVYPNGTDPLGYFKYELEPGETIESFFEVYNHTASDVAINMYPSDVKNGTDGALTGSKLSVTPKEEGAWVELATNRDTIPGGDSKTYSLEFTVPRDSEPGDHFAFVFIEPEMKDDIPDQASEGKTLIKMKVIQRIGILIWQRTPGDLDRNIEFTKPERSFEKGILSMSFSLINQGNIFVKPILGWRLYDPTGRLFLEEQPRLFGYLLPGARNDLTLPVNTNRPAPKGIYKFQILFRDEYTGKEEIEEFDVQLP